MKKRIYSIAICLILFCAGAAPVSGYDHFQKGTEAMDAGRFEEAIGYFAEALRLSGNNEAVKNNLAAAYNNAALECEKRGDFDAACGMMQKACGLDPGSKNIKKNFAVLLSNEGVRRYRAKDSRDIAGLLRDALSYDDSVAQAHALLGQLAYDRDEYREAQEQWETAVRLDPSLAGVAKQLDKLKKEMPGDYKLRDTANYHFKIRYEGVELWTASRDVLEMLEDAYQEAGRKFGIFPNKPLTVIIYTQEEFSAISGKSDWFSGVYDGKIRIRRSCVEGDKKLLRQIIFHEYMHAFVHFIAGNNVPVWLNEGIAQCYEDMPGKSAIGSAGQSFLKQKCANTAPGLDKIDQMFASHDSQDDVQFAYLYAKALVGYLIDKGWDYNVKNLLDALSRGMTVDDACNQIYFRSVEQLRDDWLHDLKFNASL